jgi:hypothetical protein
LIIIIMNTEAGSFVQQERNFLLLNITVLSGAGRVDKESSLEGEPLM